MAESRHFDIMEALSRSHVRAVKRLRSHPTVALQSLALLAEKYDWITIPQHHQAPVQPAPVQAAMPAIPAPSVAPAPQMEQPIVAAPVIDRQERPIGTQQPRYPQPTPFADEQPPSEDTRVPCPFCGRKFNADRIAKHQNVCPKNPEKQKPKRKPMNMTQRRQAALKADAETGSNR
ncbi:zinc finger C2HC domain-containing protein [Kipferlia bialata]|uniref:Zinc finger C2HC domain-containing protein n=1 Tax=Kipferlia bialata TaxID=797122 RepID=A0A391NW37_9EUKA|nr:zinc finger C2HC domain-containing protein [Kipferlia bialata]|eukprot:g9719.t1